MMGEPTRGTPVAVDATEAATQEARHENESLWKSILDDALRGAVKAGPERNLLLLGSERSGKSSVLSRLCGRDPLLKELDRGIGLEYTHIDAVISDDGDEADTGRISTWLLGNEAGCMPLLRFAINGNTYEDGMVCIVLDMTRPWSLMDDLQICIRALTRHIESLALREDVVERRRQAMVEHWQSYQATRDVDVDTGGKVASSDVKLPLEEGVIIHNLGLPLVIVCTKCDALGAVDGLGDEQHDFMQRRLRRLCLQYGAALIYTSSTANRNCELLGQYIAHRLYGAPCSGTPNAVDREAVFIPAGWDSPGKIEALGAQLRTLHPDDPWEVVFKPPGQQRRARHAEQSVEAREESEFVEALAATLEAGGAAGNTTISTMTTQSPASEKPAPAAASAKGGAGKSDEAAMAFFNSLLQKSSGAARTKNSPATGKPAVARTGQQSPTPDEP